MYKNIAIIILAGLCLFLFFKRNDAIASLGESEISPGEYGGLIALKEAFTVEEYQQLLIPFLQEALADGKVTRSEMDSLRSTLTDLGSRTLEASRKVRAQDAFTQALDDTMKSASELGSQLGTGMRDALDELSRKMDDAMRHLPGGNQAIPESVDPQLPATI